MESIALILFLSFSALWFFIVEYDRLLGVFGPTCAVRKPVMWGIVVAVMLLSVLLSSGKLLGSGFGYVSGLMDGIGLVPLTFAVLSSFMVLSLLRLFRIDGSWCYAFCGSLCAYVLASSGEWTLIWRELLSFAVVPVIAFLFSACIRGLFRLFLSGRHVHIVVLSCYMRLFVIAGIVLTAFALGVNWGGFLVAAGDALMPDSGHAVLPVVLVVIGCAMWIYIRFMRDKSEEHTGIFADSSIYVIVAVGFAVALTMLFFSFDSTTSLLGLCPVPVPVSIVVMAAVAGVETVQRSRIADNEEYLREAVSMTAVPVLSFVLSYLMFMVADIDGGQPVADFTVMVAAASVVLCIHFMGYVHVHRTQKEAMDRLLYVQRQQIYEHSKALNDMEMKVILSENQALHDAVELKKQEVTNVALGIKEQKEYLESLNATVRKIAKTADPEEKDRLIDQLGISLRQRLSYESEVDSQYFYAQAETVHEDFHAKLSARFPDLTKQEMRLATMLRLGFSSKYIATLMNVTPKSVEISRYRLRQKLGLSKGDNLVNFIKSI